MEFCKEVSGELFDVVFWNFIRKEVSKYILLCPALINHATLVYTRISK